MKRKEQKLTECVEREREKKKGIWINNKIKQTEEANNKNETRKLDKEKNQCIRVKNGSTEHSKGNETVPEKVATTRTEDGHK